MNKKILIIVSSFLVLVAVGWLFFGKKTKPQEISFTPQTNSEGTVTVEVTPVNVTQGYGQWRFDIVLNTHSVELDQDMTKIAFLKDDKGNIFQPTNWEGAPPGGHHREGILVFNSISPKTSSIQLIIQDIGEIPERKFNW